MRRRGDERPGYLHQTSHWRIIKESPPIVWGVVGLAAICGWTARLIWKGWGTDAD